MTPLVVACYQFRPVPGSPDDNTRRMLEGARDAASAGAGVVLYPELAVTGYLGPERMVDLAMPADHPVLRRVARVAAELGVAVVYGFPELDSRGRRYNSQAYIASDGSPVGVYRKTHLFGREHEWATPGEGWLVVSLADTRVGGWICYDTRFPELARAQALAGAELALVSTAWLGPGEEWELALRARALDNGVYVAGADIVDPDIGCRGRSLIVDPRGMVIARAPEDQDGLITATLDPQVMERQRSRLPLLRHRRPEVYERGSP